MSDEYGTQTDPHAGDALGHKTKELQGSLVDKSLDVTPDMGVPKEPPNQPNAGDTTSSGGYADGEHIKDTNVFSGANQRGRYDAGLD
ncbi:hypothetical protein BOTBODRAFT_28498 [Botryobasidium botryosum FD-172 SS1]|uniref:Uncharacterized protein n=1 Tax=Botryobasidium botryosum (strain FD-172 SS1) TaxID=930990 RepID=A0A067MTD6_BOTB1|nr:hypothetical protein BOTBODRAFT_28498 [Botryobasidium botryosum FD-172 SS1]